MFCSNCGNRMEPNTKFCGNCGQINPNFSNIDNPFNADDIPQKNAPLKMCIIGGILGLVVVASLYLGTTYFKGRINNYYFESGEGTKENQTPTQEPTTPVKSKYRTIIEYDHVLLNTNFSTTTEVYNLIIKDSENQKNQCGKDIKKVEDEIINKYGITAVNLCEMDATFARELGNVIKLIFDEYPYARGYLTNLSLFNAGMSNSNLIAAFMPVFIFVRSDTSSSMPVAVKMHVLLNARYFLNQDLLEEATAQSSKMGHFPPNSNIYAPMAHEFGHFISYLALLKHHNLSSTLIIDTESIYALTNVLADFSSGDYSLSMITEAFENYKKDYPNTNYTLDEWRATISGYAVTKRNTGEYIYDETIAESFHDVYINGDNAKDASKYIINVLKSKLEG